MGEADAPSVSRGSCSFGGPGGRHEHEVHSNWRRSSPHPTGEHVSCGFRSFCPAPVPLRSAPRSSGRCGGRKFHLFWRTMAGNWGILWNYEMANFLCGRFTVCDPPENPGDFHA